MCTPHVCEHGGWYDSKSGTHRPGQAQALAKNDRRGSTQRIVHPRVLPAAEVDGEPLLLVAAPPWMGSPIGSFHPRAHGYDLPPPGRPGRTALLVLLSRILPMVRSRYNSKTSGQLQSEDGQHPNIQSQWLLNGQRESGQLWDLSAPTSLSGCRILPE